MASGNEIWIDIPGFEGYYQASNKGQIRTVGRMVNCTKGKKWCPERIRKQGRVVRPNGRIDMNITLSKNNLVSSESVARLIATCFHKNPEMKPQVNHIDGNTLNNNADNLEWVTGKENMRHAADNGLINLHWTGKRYGDHPKSVPILQFDLKGKKINQWDSATEAANELHIHRQGIVHCLKRRQHTAHGFIWKYKTAI